MINTLKFLVHKYFLRENALETIADMSKLQEVLLWIKNDMIKHNVANKAQFNMITAAEEIFSNIISYAYLSQENAIVKITTKLSHNTYYVTFMDKGKKYNPLNQKGPNLDADLQERNIGGLGVFLAKKVSDIMTYSYKNKYNILTIGVDINKGR